MILDYWWRLAWLALASFFVIHLVTAGAVALFSRRAIHFAAGLQPRAAARLLFLLRLLPIALATLIVTTVCIPSYLLFEPEAAGEGVSLACIAGAALTLLLFSLAIIRSIRSTLRSARTMRRWRREARPERIFSSTALVIDSNIPFLALAGILRPTLIASRGLLHRLSPDQLRAAVRHEEAHRASLDNLKRLLMDCAPGLLPFSPGFTRIERAWAKYAERAADDQCAAGDRSRALLLADALVLVARAGAPGPNAHLAAPLLPETGDLSERVLRLLDPAQPVARARWYLPAALACLALAVIQPFTLRLAHEALECFTR